MIRVIVRGCEQVAPDGFNTVYETRDFDCKEMEKFILSWAISDDKPFSGFAGIVIIHDKATE